MLDSNGAFNDADMGDINDADDSDDDGEGEGEKGGETEAEEEPDGACVSRSARTMASFAGSYCIKFTLVCSGP